MNFYDVFVRSPVNRQAAQVFSYAEDSQDISEEEIIYLIKRITRKRRYLEKKIGIQNKRQRKNLMTKIARAKSKNNKGLRVSINPYAVDEWVRSGKALKCLNSELEARKVRAK